MKDFLFLLFIASFLLAILSITPQLPRIISHQDPLDTDSIHSYNSRETTAIFNNRYLVNIPTPPLLNPPVLADVQNLNSTKRVEVDLTRQLTYTFEDGRLVNQFTISSGTYNRTPTGEFTIWVKVPRQKMSGGSKELGTYYYLPNVPYVAFFYNDKIPKKVGYSFHGTYWHNNFGTPMSHGCINMKTPDAKTLYDWIEVGTPISIYGKYQPTKKI